MRTQSEQPIGADHQKTSRSSPVGTRSEQQRRTACIYRRVPEQRSASSLKLLTRAGRDHTYVTVVQTENALLGTIAAGFHTPVS